MKSKGEGLEIGTPTSFKAFLSRGFAYEPLDEGRAAVLHGSSLPRSDAHGQDAAMRVSDYLSESLSR
jgi:hypothetical protein